jgi:hypothetical protein
VFDRFVQLTKNDRRGVGLGLFISKCIVQGHRGRIWVENRTDLGSTFCFALPIGATAGASTAWDQRNSKGPLSRSPLLSRRPISDSRGSALAVHAERLNMPPRVIAVTRAGRHSEASC